MVTAGLSLLFGPALAWLMNCMTPRHWALRRSLGGVERVLHDAHAGKRLVALTLNCGKIYVGRVLSFLDSEGQPSDVEIEPSFSGYRDEQMRMILTTDYEVIRDLLLRGRASQLCLPHHWRGQWCLAIRPTTIVSAASFDSDIYGEFNPQWRDQLMRRRWVPMQGDFVAS